MEIHEWSLVLYNGARDNRPKPVVWREGDLIAQLHTAKTWKRSKVDAPAWSPVKMKPEATRAAGNVEAITMLVLDCDAGEDIRILETLGDEFIRLGHTSWSHSETHPKARLVFPFRCPCPVRHWPKVWSAASRWALAQGVTVDASTKDPSRLFFLPYVPWQPGPEDSNPHLRRFESWVYGDCPEGSTHDVPGALPNRRRDWLCWAQLACEFPEPPPKPVVYFASAGRLDETTDDRERRRRAFAIGMLRHRCRAMVAAGEGGKGGGTGRNNRTFALARLVARLVAAGCLDQAQGIDMVQTAAAASGLSANEYSRAIRNGLVAGQADGPEDIDSLLTDDR